MKTSIWVAIIIGSCSNCIAMMPAAAQEGQWALGLSGGSLGVGPQLSYRPTAHVGVRANATFLGFSRDEEVNDIDYEGDLDLNSFGAMLDWYPFGGGFRVSVGGRVNNNEIDIVGAPSTSVTVGDTEYTPQQIGRLSGTLTTDDFAPQLTIGYGGTLGEGFTFGAEIGVLWQGAPTIENLRATGLLASAPQLQADIDREEQEIEDELDDYEVWPILQVELVYRF